MCDWLAQRLKKLQQSISMPPPRALRPSPGVCGGLTFFFNFLVLASGLIIASGGCFIIYYLVQLKIDAHLITMTGYIIGTGIGLILVSIIGLVGICGRISWCLTFYIFFLSLILAAEVTAGILFLVYSSDVVDKLKQVLTKIAKGMNKQGKADDILIKLQSLGCNDALGELLNKYQAPIGVSLILLGAAEVLIVIMANYTRKNLKVHRRA
ncbi:hypothetical protein ACTXT7_000041 [Hymenolepis weldensis]